MPEPNPVVLGRKFCTHCGRWRYIHDFYARKWEDGVPSGFSSYCQTCLRVNGRRVNGMKKRGEPYGQRKFHRATPEEARIARHDNYVRKMADPAWAEQRREYGRIYAEGHRRAAGIPERKFIRKRKVPGKQRIFLDPAPIVRLMADHIASVRFDGDENYGWNSIARLVGLPPRALYRWRYGESTRIRIDKADQIAVRLGYTLDLVYPQA
jgi:hypothetical protein